MSIELNEARKKLDIIEQLTNNPQLILTDLYSDDISGRNFLYQINVHGKYIMDYLREHLMSIHPFTDCVIKNDSSTFSFYLPALKENQYLKYEGDDLIARISVDDKTYKIFSDCVSKYEEVMTKEYTLTEVQLSNWWKRFTDLSIKNRLHQAYDVIHSDKKILVKILDLRFWLIMTNKRRKQIAEALEREYNKINQSNIWHKKEYDKHIDIQKYYLEQAPTQIEKIRTKQKEIEEYLKTLNYIKDEEMGY